jgi:Zn-dependent protease/predicted transcriptional regulator
MRVTRGSFRIASFRGIPIRIHFSLLLALPLLSVLFGGTFRQAALSANVGPERLGGSSLLWGLGVAVGLFSSVLIHELAHVIYALRTGGKVQGITLMIVGGVSEITELPKRSRDEVLMALAGPLTSLGIGALLIGALWLLPEPRYFSPRFALVYLAGLNIFLGLFNLVPAFPMDGGRILRGLLVGPLGLARATRVASWVGKAFSVLFVIGGLFSFNLILAAIGVYIFISAESESRQVLLRTALEKLRVEQLMTPCFHGVDVGASLEEAFDELRHARRPALPVTERDLPVGWVALGDLLQVRESERATRTVREHMKPAAVVTPGDDAWTALRQMVEAQPPQLLVVEQGRLVGTLDGRDLNAGLVLHLSREESRGARSQRWRQERPA